MKSRIAIRIVRFLAAAFLMEGWLLAGSAPAGCGDYVMVGGDGEHGLHAAHASDGRNDRQPPCQGPNCSRRSDPLPSQPGTMATLQHDWGLASNGAAIARVGPVGIVRPERRPKAIHSIAHIFRPPRQSARSV